MAEGKEDGSFMVEKVNKLSSPPPEMFNCAEAEAEMEEVVIEPRQGLETRTGQMRGGEKRVEQTVNISLKSRQQQQGREVWVVLLRRQSGQWLAGHRKKLGNIQERGDG